MKKIILVIGIMIAEIFCVFANSTDSVSSFQLIKNIQFNVENEYYAEAFSLCEKMETSYPNSRYLEKALIAKTEASFFLGKKVIAKNTLVRVKDDKKIPYVAARIYFEEENYQKALPLFYLSIKNDADKKERVLSSEYFASKCLFLLKDYDKAFSLLHLLISQNGYSFEKGEVTSLYCEILYEKNNFKKVIELYEKIESILPKMNENYSRKIILMAGISYDTLHISDKAQVLYQQISTLYGNEVDSASFWVRMGIESFSKKDYSDCLRCFTVASSTDNNRLLQIIEIYKGAVLVNTKSYLEGYNSLLSKKITDEQLYPSYLTLLVCYSAKAKQYSQTEIYTNQLIQLANKNNTIRTLPEYQVAMYWYVYSLVEQEKYNKAIEFANELKSSSINILTLKGIAESKSNKDYQATFTKANDIANTLISTENSNNDSFNKEVFQNYVVSLLANQKTDFITQKNFVLLDNFNYLNGLAEYVDGNWENCIQSMKNVLNSSDQKSSNYAYAKFYTGYSLYRLQKNEEAYNTLKESSDLLSNNNVKYLSSYLASQCALANYYVKNQQEWLNNAKEECKKATEISIPTNTKMDAILLLSDLYSIEKDFDKAIELLKPYSIQKNDEGVRTLYKLASVYLEKGDLTLADNSYSQLSSSWPMSTYASEARYNQGKIYFDNKDWGLASDRFSMYRRLYPEGKYYYQVCYLNGVCLKNLGNDSLAILLLQETLVEKQKTSYRLSALLDLMKLYRDKSDYRSAIDAGRLILSEYPEQAKSENVKKQLTEITLLASGEDEKSASLLADFIRLGEVDTIEGRKAGFELAQIYMATPAKRDEGFKLVKRILSSKNLDIEAENENCAVLYNLSATYYREKLEYYDAALDFLSAAQLYASFNKEMGSKMLYCAIESYDCAFRKSDCQEILKMMNTLYPESQWTKRAESLVQNNQ